MDLFIDLLTGLCFFLGSLCIIIGACGLIKLPDVFSRIHAAGMIDTGGTAFFILGMMIQSGWSLITVKLLLIVVLDPDSESVPKISVMFAIFIFI